MEKNIENIGKYSEINPHDLEDAYGLCCPKCNRPECLGDCGLFTAEEKAENIHQRYFNEKLDAFGRIKVERIRMEKNPFPKVKIGSYSYKNKKK